MITQRIINSFLPLNTKEKITSLFNAMVKRGCTFNKMEQTLITPNILQKLLPFFNKSFKEYCRKYHYSHRVHGAVYDTKTNITEADLKQLEEKLKKEKYEKGCKYIDNVFQDIKDNVDISKFFINCPVVWTKDLFDYLQHAIEESHLPIFTKNDFLQALSEYRHPNQKRIEAPNNSNKEKEYNEWVRIWYTPMK